MAKTYEVKFNGKARRVTVPERTNNVNEAFELFLQMDGDECEHFFSLMAANFFTEGENGMLDNMDAREISNKLYAAARLIANRTSN